MCAPLIANATWLEPHGVSIVKRGRASSSRARSITRTSPASAIRQHVRSGVRRHRHHPFVVGVEHGGPRRGQRLHELALGDRHAVDPTDPFGVRVTDGGDHPDVGSGDVAQPGDLAEPAHPHLQHEHLGVVRRVEDRDREALLVVEAALVGRGPSCGGARRGDEVLRRRLAHAAGDAHDAGGRPAARPAGERHQRGRRVGDLDRRAVTAGVGRLTREERDRSSCERLTDEVVAVAFGHDRHEQFARAGRP